MKSQMRWAISVATVMLMVLIHALSISSASAAKKRRRARPKKARIEKPAPPVASIRAHADLSTVDLLAKARSLYESLEYEEVIPVAEQVLAREDADIGMRLDAYFLQGCSLAIVGNPIDAEKPFRFLLRGRPDYDMPAETPPKILAVFRKVQVEERAIVDQMAELRRARIVRELELEPDVPEEATGGQSLEFGYTLRDPGRAVQSISVHYRRETESKFSTLALDIDETGTWYGELPGAWTENEHGLDLQYFVTTADDRGQDLLTMGDARSPMSIKVAPGTVAQARPIYETWWFWTAAGVAVLGAAAGSWALYDQATSVPETSGLVELPE